MRCHVQHDALSQGLPWQFAKPAIRESVRVLLRIVSSAGFKRELIYLCVVALRIGSDSTHVIADLDALIGADVYICLFAGTQDLIEIFSHHDAPDSLAIRWRVAIEHDGFWKRG